MRYTLWTDDRQIGETQFEFRTSGSRRAGLFFPTEFGLVVLPGITAMFPALLAFGEMCRQEGVDIEDDSRPAASAALETFGGTPQGRRLFAAAKRVAAVDVQEPGGRTVQWESLAINDLEMLARLAEKKEPGASAELAKLPGSASYIVSLTLAARSDRMLAGSHYHGAQRVESAPH